MTKPAYAQTSTHTPSPVPIRTPSIPQFAVKFVDSSYDEPTTTSVDQYTGKTITNQGYHVENLTIHVVIKNQPFSSYLENGQNISFYYTVREKGHFFDNWVEFYYPDSGYPIESKTDYSTLTYVLGNSSIFGYTPPDAQIDFQVQALVGSVHRIENGSATNQLELFLWIFDGQSSDWSNTQTVTIPASSSSPTSTPTVPEFPTLILVFTFLLLATLLETVVIKRKESIRMDSLNKKAFLDRLVGYDSFNNRQGVFGV